MTLAQQSKARRAVLAARRIRPTPSRVVVAIRRAKGA